jgi:hypothetical protein
MRAAAVAAILVLSGCAGRGVQELEAALASRPSATAVLQARCGQPVRAERLRDLPKAVPPAALSTATGFRHVRLKCGDAVLSEAFNWYAPARLTAEMNHVLDTTDRPFGAVAAPLEFSRERLASHQGRLAPCPGGTVLSQRGLLRLPDGTALAVVIECYTRSALR